MDITDDEQDGDLLVQSADDTATDSDLDVSDDENKGITSGEALAGLISGAVSVATESVPVLGGLRSKNWRGGLVSVKIRPIQCQRLR